jgi:hypothetical protein
LLVDDDLMVEPTEGYEIVRVGCSALGPGNDVVDLESMVAGTPVCLADMSVTVEDESA